MYERASSVQLPCHALLSWNSRALCAVRASVRTALVPLAARTHQMRAAMDPLRIDEIVRRLLESVPPALRGVQQDLEANFRAVLRAALGRLDLVTRDEFDAQTKVLERTRAKAEAFEVCLVSFVIFSFLTFFVSPVFWTSGLL